jgi:hypothetical protein
VIRKIRLLVVTDQPSMVLGVLAVDALAAVNLMATGLCHPKIAGIFF